MPRINSKEPHIIQEHIKKIDLWDIDGEILSIIQLLQELHDNYIGDYLKLELDYEPADYDYSGGLHLTGHRYETQEEIEKRLAEWKKDLEKRKESKRLAEEQRNKRLQLTQDQERKLYEKLKKKYGEQ